MVPQEVRKLSMLPTGLCAGLLFFLMIAVGFQSMLLMEFAPGLYETQTAEPKPPPCPPIPDAGRSPLLAGVAHKRQISKLVIEGHGQLGGVAMMVIAWPATEEVAGRTEALFTPVFKGNVEPSGSFTQFAYSDFASLVPFLRTIITQVEDELLLFDYHMRVIPMAPQRERWINRSQYSVRVEDDREFHARVEQAGFLILVVGSRDPRCPKKVPRIDSLNGDNLEAPVAYIDGDGKTIRPQGTSAKDLLVAETPRTRCFLDAQGRPMYVVTLRHFVRRQRELDDEELHELWVAGLEAISKFHGRALKPPTAQSSTSQQLMDSFRDLRLNAGLYQNLAHLHLKIWMEEADFLEHWQSSPSYQKVAPRKSAARE